jgi:hypothetical protein
LGIGLERSRVGQFTEISVADVSCKSIGCGVFVVLLGDKCFGDPKAPGVARGKAALMRRVVPYRSSSRVGA